MASILQEPKESHAKKMSVVTSSTVEIRNDRIWRPAGRKKMRKFPGRTTAGLEPKPSDDVEDPLVRPLVPKSRVVFKREVVADVLHRTGQDGRRRLLTGRCC